jgi:hypothetical protein
MAGRDPGSKEDMDPGRDCDCKRVGRCRNWRMGSPDHSLKKWFGVAWT